MDFLRYRWLYFLISAFVLLPGIFSLVRWGLQPSIDFTGGSLIEIQNSKFKIQNYNEKLKIKTDEEKTKFKERIEQIDGVNLSSIQETGKNTYLLKLKPIDQAKKEEIIKNLEKDLGETQELRFETIGPILGKELLVKTIIGLGLAAGFILFYIAYQFKDRRWGICATAATFHDSLVILGVFSLLGHFWQVEVDTLFVTAVLTSLSFSVHDTVVVYDRIRETMRRFPKADFTQAVNKAITETMTRSVNNSLTIIFMLLCLYLLGGETIKWFVFALLVGTISGTYSSPFVATPLLVVWQEIKEKKR